MSVQAMSWVLDHSPTRGSDRLVLLSIANHAGAAPSDGAWEAWPGTALLQREARLDRDRTVRDVLARLVNGGHIERVVNGAPDVRIPADRRPNLYRVLLDRGEACGDPRCRWCGGTRDVLPLATGGGTRHAERGDATRPNGGTRGDRTGGRDASAKPSVEPSLEPSDETLLRVEDARVIPLAADDPFDAFWTAYPRKADKGLARRAFATARKKVDPLVIVEGARRYAEERRGQDHKFTKLPATWLNAEAWANEPTGRRGTSMVGPSAALTDDEDARRRALPAGEVSPEELWG